MDFMVQIMGVMWRFRDRFRFRKNKKGERYRGLCELNKKTIKVGSHVKDKEHLEIAIHEVTHAADWYKDEEYVDQFSKDLATILYDHLGYRRIK